MANIWMGRRLELKLEEWVDECFKEKVVEVIGLSA